MSRADLFPRITYMLILGGLISACGGTSATVVTDNPSQAGALITDEAPAAQGSGSNLDSESRTACIEPIDLPPATNSGILRRIEVAEKKGDRAQGVGLTPDGKFAYVALEHADGVAVVNLNKSAVVEWVKLGVEPQGVDVTPDGCYALVGAWDDHLYVISTGSNTVEARIPFTSEGSWGPQVVATKDDKTAWVSSYRQLHRVNFREGIMTDLVQVIEPGSSGHITAFDITDDEKTLFVSVYDSRDPYIARVDLKEKKVVWKKPIDGGEIFFDEVRERLLVSEPYEPNVLILDPADGNSAGVIPIGDGNARGLKGLAQNTRLFVGADSSGQLVEVGLPKK